MKGLLFLLAFAVLPLIGWPLARRLCPSLPAPAAIGVAGALGAVLLGVEMLVLSALGLSWSVPLLLAPFLLLAFVRRSRPVPKRTVPDHGAPGRAGVAAAALTLAVVAYAVVTARASAPDLLLFWGAKGQRFAQARAIDAAYLGDPLHVLMHADYPPLFPSLYAWASLVAGRFAWGAAMLTLPVFLALSLLTFYGFAQRPLGRRSAAELTAVLAALLGFGMISSLTAGNADPLLLAFEVLALSALTFRGDDREGLAAAAVGLTGCVLTKVEGAPFAVIVLTAFVIFGASTGRLRKAGLVALPAAVALAGWLVFCRVHGLVDVYQPKGRMTISTEFLPALWRELVRQASYGVAFAPWIVLLALVGLGARTRLAAIPLLTALGFLAFMVYMYTTLGRDPTLWIDWSAGRLLLTPLLGLTVAAAARAAPE